MNPFETFEQTPEQREYLKSAINVIYQYKKDFTELKENNQKLAFVKLLKELVGISGLKDAKDVTDLYWDGKLPNPVKEERKDKLLRLEELAKTPLVDELIIKIKDLSFAQMRVFLLELTIDELLNIDQKFQKENE